ncbi:MAG: hypothetical protein ACTSRW_07610 [Candidatus Helarchaeota archaeon]
MVGIILNEWIFYNIDKPMIRDSIIGTTIGEETTFLGVAANAKGGACITLRNGEVIYIVGVREWSDEYLNRKIVITGVFNEKKLIPDPIVDEDGAISAGAQGNQHVLENIKKIEIA